MWTKSNTADSATSGAKISESHDNDLWWYGPTRVRETPAESWKLWDNDQLSEGNLNGIMTEYEPEKRPTVTFFRGGPPGQNRNHHLDSIVMII